VIPILTGNAMRDADAHAVATRGSQTLVNLAGTAVALEAKQILGSCYGARVAVVVGPGLNGADGRVAAAWLASRGSHVDVIDVQRQPDELRGYNLVIDAAFGLGCTRPYAAPRATPDTPVLAVDLPSGVDADSGEILGSPSRATVTLALGALKPAHLNGASTAYVGELRFASLDIVESFEDGLLEDSDLNALINISANDHKWTHAIQAFVGSPPMPGAAALVLRGALAGGASMVRLTSNGEVAGRVELPPEVVHDSEGSLDERCRAVIAGPGLGSSAPSWLRDRLVDVKVPVVLDADGLDRELIAQRTNQDEPWILTPHDGEFARLTGDRVPENRFEAVRRLARDTNCVVLLKGPITVLSSPTGTLRVVNSGTSSLATAGSGDVLAGLIAATIARGHDPLTAGALAAHLHGRAGAQLPPYAGASAIPPAISTILSRLARSAP
jgi:NAD(P)H-hydrate epimerase